MKSHEIHNVAEPIKALRCCIVDFNSTQSRQCNECPYGIYADGKKTCENKAKRDAADAREADEKRIAELERILKAVQENSGINFRLWQEAEAQLPKEGEWIRITEHNYKCSACAAWFVVDDDNELKEFHYCPNCGAKMKGEQE